MAFSSDGRTATVFGSKSFATRSLLRFGVIVGPFYLAVGLIQALVRDGFDLARHPLSLLANGPGGWVQGVNFVLSGLMVIAAAYGIRRALGPETKAVTWSLVIFGVSMLLAAVFRADPVDGFPVGTPEGVPTTITTSGLLHFMAGGIGFLALAVSCFAAAAVLSRRQNRGLARLSLVAGLLVVVGFFGPMAAPSSGTIGIWVSVVVGWFWLTWLSAHLHRSSFTHGEGVVQPT